MLNLKIYDSNKCTYNVYSYSYEFTRNSYVSKLFND